MTITGEILSLLATGFLLALVDAYIFWDNQDALRISFAMGVNFALLCAYSITRDKLAGPGGDAIS
jgi:hypothetical protein